MPIVRYLAVLLILTLPAAAAPARVLSPAALPDADYCAPGARSRVTSGGSGFLLGTKAWAEGEACIHLPLSMLLAAASKPGVMTWRGVTRLVSVSALPLGSPFTVSRTAVTYEAYHSYIFCRRAQWPMVWTSVVTAGSPAAPYTGEISGVRVPGGDSNGAYLKRLEIRAELTSSGPGRTSARITYKVEAPLQSAGDAADAVTGFLARLEDVARGGAGQVAAADPDCPYPTGG